MSYPCVPPVPSIIAPLVQYCKRHHVYHKHVSFNVFIAAFSAQPFCVFSGTTLFDSGTVCYSFFFHLSTAVQHALVLYRTNHARSVHITACLTRLIDTGQQHCKSLWCSAVESTPCGQSTIRASLCLQYMLMQKVAVKACHMPATLRSTWA